jgi:hypothetical protein
VFPLPETTAEDKGAGHVTFLLNFFDELRRKVPHRQVTGIAGNPIIGKGFAG